MALIGGSDNYILTGCENTTGSTWAAGFVVLNGELLPFTGGTGTGTSNVRIKETKTDVVAGYDTYSEAYTSRIVEFGSNVGGANTFVWNTFTRIKTNLQLAAESATKTELEALSNLMMPKGGIIMWSGAITSIPTGYALCNGATVTGYGVVPDLRGRFVVGYDERTSNTPNNVVDGKELNYAAVGNIGGKPSVLLKSAESGVPNHNHPLKIVGNSAGMKYVGFGSASNNIDVNAQTIYTNDNTVQDASQSHENRPPYFVLAYIIKVV